MKLQEYIDGLLELLGNDPSLAEATVMYAKDDEGNGFQMVGYPPSVRYRFESERGDYHSEDLLDKDGDPEGFADYADEELETVVLIN